MGKGHAMRPVDEDVAPEAGLGAGEAGFDEQGFQRVGDALRFGWQGAGDAEKGERQRGMGADGGCVGLYQAA